MDKIRLINLTCVGSSMILSLITVGIAYWYPDRIDVILLVNQLFWTWFGFHVVFTECLRWTPIFNALYLFRLRNYSWKHALMIWFVVCVEVGIVVGAIVLVPTLREHWKTFVYVYFQIVLYAMLTMLLIHFAWTRMTWTTNKQILWNLLFLDMIWTHSIVLRYPFHEETTQKGIQIYVYLMLEVSASFAMVSSLIGILVQKLKKMDDEPLSDTHSTSLLEFF
jgi:hypothetical protein